MPKFVLNVLDGPGKGRSIPLSLDVPLLIGRKPSNQLRLSHDEKVSGQHAEIRSEGEMLILKDLGSTNGTRVDGKKIQEVPIGHGDRFQIGETMLQLIDVQQDAGVDEDMSIQIDQAMLAKSRKRSPATLLFLLVLILAGGAAYYFFGSPASSAGPARARGAKLVEIPGNLLQAADAYFEKGANLWLPLASGGSFDLGTEASSGRHGLWAQLGAAEGTELGESDRFAGSASPAIPVQEGRAYRAQAMLAADEGVRVALRLAFYAAAPAPDPEAEPNPEAEQRLIRAPLLVVGSRLEALQGRDFAERSVSALAPSGAVEARAILVAVLAPGSSQECSAYADDIALVQQGAADPVLELAGSRLQVTGSSQGVDSPEVGGIGNAWLRIAGRTALASFASAPAENDPSLQALAKLLPLPLNDIFGDMRVLKGEGAFQLRSSAAGAMQFLVPGDMLGGQGYLVRREAQKEGAHKGRIFEGHRGAAQVADVSGILLGEGIVRFLLSWPKAGAFRADALPNGALRFTIDFGGELDIQLEFQDEVRKAQRLYREALAADRAGQIGKALQAYAELVKRWPFDQDATNKARARRSQLLLAGKERFLAQQRAFDEAKAFGYEGLYRRLLKDLDQMLLTYAGAEKTAFYEQAQSFRAEVHKALTQLLREKAKGVAERYLRIHDSLVESDLKRLAELVERYMRQEFPESEAVQKLGR
ncbi:MAG: hypothetical protein CSA62_10975 [Planctomycetota bacterium]|nr:MAG: hypothetical protein CSA62_10975 [Planctomycetota bacterium]